MPKLKSLRGAVGSYGRVSAGGIVEVDDAMAKKLLATTRFVLASGKDIAAAQKAQEAALAVKVTGTAPGFMSIPDKPQATDRLQDMISRGALTVEEAQKFTAMQIELSPDEIQTMVRRNAEEATGQIEAAKAGLQALAAELGEREADIVRREADLAELDRREADIAKREAELEEREHALADAMSQADAAAKEAETKAKTKADATGDDSKKGGK